MNMYILPALGDRFADTVTRADVTELIDSIVETKPVRARLVHAQLSAFYTWAMPRLEKLPANPCRDAGRPPKAVARDRVLTDDELRALWQVADAEPLPWGPALKLLMLTGARRDEVFNAGRAEFNLKTAEWVIPAERAKNGLPHIVPLPKAAVAVVEAVPGVEDSAKLFPARGNLEKGPSGYSRAQARFRASMEKVLGRTQPEHWRLHDIRRTVATGLQRLGVRVEVTEAVLNHVSGARGGIAGVYQRHDWKAEKRAALDAWATELDRIVRAGLISSTS
jgi:integrase